MKSPSNKWLALLLASVASSTVVLTVIVIRSPAAVGPGCEVLDEPLAESAEFIPAEMQRTSAFNPILPDLAPPPSSRLDALPGFDSLSSRLQLEITSPDGGVYSYFLDRPVAGMLYSDFVRNGGIQLHREPLVDPQPFADYLLSTQGERALRVQVDEYVGALVWADPTREGIRTHNLYWSDGTYNFALIVDLPAVATLNMGRDLVCDR